MDLFKLVKDNIFFDDSDYILKPAGSIYRGEKTPGDVDIIMVVKKISNILFTLESDRSITIFKEGTRFVSFEIKLPYKRKYTPVQIWLSTPIEYPFMLLAWAGSGYSIGLRKKANSMGYKLNQYGIFCKKTNRRIATWIKSIRDIQDFLGVSNRDLRTDV